MRCRNKTSLITTGVTIGSAILALLDSLRFGLWPYESVANRPTSLNAASAPTSSVATRFSWWPGNPQRTLSPTVPRTTRCPSRHDVLQSQRYPRMDPRTNRQSRIPSPACNAARAMPKRRRPVHDQPLPLTSTLSSPSNALALSSTCGANVQTCIQAEVVATECEARLGAHLQLAGRGRDGGLQL
jgi:hypothetical protein